MELVGWVRGFIAQPNLEDGTEAMRESQRFNPW